MQHGLEVRETHAFVDDQAFDLVEHRRMGLVRVAAIHATRRNDLDRRPLGDHRSNLHWRRMRAQQVATREIERIVHGTSRVVVGDIQRREVVEIVFDLRSGAHTETGIFEDLLDP